MKQYLFFSIFFTLALSLNRISNLNYTISDDVAKFFILENIPFFISQLNNTELDHYISCEEAVNLTDLHVMNITYMNHNENSVIFNDNRIMLQIGNFDFIVSFRVNSSFNASLRATQV
jgi:hypothetical protein